MGACCAPRGSECGGAVRPCHFYKSPTVQGSLLPVCSPACRCNCVHPRLVAANPGVLDTQLLKEAVAEFQRQGGTDAEIALMADPYQVLRCAYGRQPNLLTALGVGQYWRTMAWPPLPPQHGE